MLNKEDFLALFLPDEFSLESTAIIIFDPLRVVERVFRIDSVENDSRTLFTHKTSFAVEQFVTSVPNEARTGKIVAKTNVVYVILRSHAPVA